MPGLVRRLSVVVCHGRKVRVVVSVSTVPVVASRRLALVIGSQCAALDRLSVLPDGPGPVALAGLPDPQRLLIRLRDLLVAGVVGGCDPVNVDGALGPGLLLNPPKATADAALTRAVREAHEQEAVLLVTFLGHGTALQHDPAAPARHRLHVWDTVPEPVNPDQERGWDPYDVVREGYERYVEVRTHRPETPKMVGLVLLVDAFRASWAKQVDAWGGVRGGLLSACLGYSGDQAAWDACFTNKLVTVLERGVPTVLPRDGLTQGSLQGECSSS